MRHHHLALSALALGFALVLAQSAPGEAAKKRYGSRGHGTITVESNYTTDRVTGAVRTGRNGPEVQLPSGAWIPCNLGCARTLRTQSIDFWHWIDENSRD